MVVSKMKNTEELVLPDLKPVRRFHKSRHCGTPLKKKHSDGMGRQDWEPNINLIHLLAVDLLTVSIIYNGEGPPHPQVHLDTLKRRMN